MARAWLTERAWSAAGDPPLCYGVAAALVLNVTLYAYVWSVQSTLPPLMPLHYNGSGVVDLIGSSAELFKLPGIATGILVANTLLAVLAHRDERPASHLLVWAAVVAQILFAGGTWVLVSRAAG